MSEILVKMEHELQLEKKFRIQIPKNHKRWI